MLWDIIGLVGTPMGGALFGQVAQIFQDRRENAREKADREFEKDLAYKEQLAPYYEAMASRSDDGTYSPFVWTICGMLILFSLTYTTAVTSLFLWDPSGVISAKDPAETGKEISLGFGLVKFDLSNNRIIFLSRAGLGYLLLYPILVVFGMVIQRFFPKRGA